MAAPVMQAEFLSKVPIPHENLITIDDWDVCSAAAHGYENRLKYVVAPVSNLLVLASTFLHIER